MIIAAIALSVLIGVSLGLLGGGGSILTIPILVYVLGVEEKSAIAGSLLLVALTSAAAAVQHARARNVQWRVGLIFAAAGMAGAFAGGRLAAFIPGWALIALFAVVMFATGAAMWRRAGRKEPAEPRPAAHAHLVKIVVEGVTVGLVTGLVGAGGGFLIVPALALLGGLPMRQAVGTSLVVIALNSIAGFAGYASHVAVDYGLIGGMSLSAVAGSFLGAAAGKRLSPEKLRKSFAGFVLVMAVVMLGKQLYALQGTPAAAWLHAVPPAAWIGAVVGLVVGVALTLAGERWRNAHAHR